LIFTDEHVTASFAVDPLSRRRFGRALLRTYCNQSANVLSLFGKPAYYCQSAKECYCKKWGMCDLKCESEGWCLGRIWSNPNKHAPLGLPETIPVRETLRIEKWTS